MTEGTALNRSIGAGAVGGLSGGIVFDALMRVLPMATGHESMITFAAQALDEAAHPMVGWFVYPIYGVVIGALFGLLLHAYEVDDFTATLWGASYGALWWIVSELILIPALLGTSPFSTAGGTPMRNVAIPLLIGHLAYGAILGLLWGRGTIRPARPATLDSSIGRAA